VPSTSSTVPYVTSQARPPTPTWPAPWEPTTGGPPMPWASPSGGFQPPRQWTPLLAAGPEHLDATDAMGISSWRITDVVETSSSWRAAVAMGVMGAGPVTSALASSGMSPI
jgi:hypothetical protein